MAELITIPNGSLINDIDIFINKQTKLPAVNVRQYDTGKRYIRATVWNETDQDIMLSTDTIVFSATKPDGNPLFLTSGIDAEGRIIFEITQNVTASYGIFNAEFRIYNNKVVDAVNVSTLKTSYDVRMIVTKSNTQEDAIISTPEFSALTDAVALVGDLINDMNDAISRANTAIEDANEATESINTLSTNITNAEIIRVENEDERMAKDATRPDYIYLTQAEYDALPDVDKDDINKVYEITDNDGVLPTELEALIADTEAAATAAWAAAGASLPDVGTVGTYTKVTTDSKGRVSSGTAPTNIGDLGITNVYTKTEVDTKTNEVDSQLADIEYSVKSYGAVGDGTNATQAFLDCIAAIPEGKKIIFPNGTYIIDDVVITKSINFDFDNSTILTSGTSGIKLSGTLKSTHTVTADYVESTSKNSLILNNTTGIVVGDLINVQSTELFDTSRLYYVKGGNAIVTKISGSTLYFNMVFPFNMTAASITVEVYSPITTKIENIGLIQGQQDISTSAHGITIEYGKNISISRVKSDNYQTNVLLKRCVNSHLDFIDTGHAKNAISDAWDGYGIEIYSCTGVRITNPTANSGQHGITWGGQELSYGLYIEGGSCKGEVWNLGIGAHENVYDVTLVNVKMSGCSLAGNIHAIGCDIIPSENTAQTTISLSCAESPRYANYKFTNCRLGMSVLVSDYYQVECPTRKYIGNIVFEDCPVVGFTSDINVKTAGVKIAEINKVIINRCDDFSFECADIVENVEIKNCDGIKNKNLISQLAVSAVFQNIKNITIENVTLAKRYEVISLKNVGKLIIKNLEYNATDYGNDSFVLSGITDLYLENVNNFGAVRGIALAAIANLVIVGGNIALYDSLATTFANVTKARASGSVIKGEYMDIITATDGKRYKVQLDAAGAFANTLIV